MKNASWIVVVVAAVAIVGGGGVGLYSLGLQRGMSSSASAVSALSPAPSGKLASAERITPKPLYWHDPMFPGQKFDKPGKSPFMDMQLVPVYGENDSDGSRITISPRVQQNLGIRSAEVVKGNLSSSLTAVGSVAFNDRDVTVIQARSNGFVEKLYVRASLDPVRKGQAIAELYVPEWIAAQEEFLTVSRMQDNAVAGLRDGARQRMRLAGMNFDQIRLIETTGKVHPRMTITAPIGGIVAELGMREGMTVMTGAPLMRINGIGTVWVNAEVPENFAAQVRPGNLVEARTPALPGKVFNGKVNAILPEVSTATRTLKARIELANPSSQLVPGMFATLTFTTRTHNDVLLVPSEAVIQTGKRTVVMLAQGEGKFNAAEVEIGAESNGQTEIMKGLDAGQKVVISGQFLIDSEASLKSTVTPMSDPTASGNTNAKGDQPPGDGGAK